MAAMKRSRPLILGLVGSTTIVPPPGKDMVGRGNRSPSGALGDIHLGDAGGGLIGRMSRMHHGHPWLPV